MEGRLFCLTVVAVIVVLLARLVIAINCLTTHISQGYQSSRVRFICFRFIIIINIVIIIIWCLPYIPFLLLQQENQTKCESVGTYFSLIYLAINVVKL